MEPVRIFLFGESEKGVFRKPTKCTTLIEFCKKFGNKDSENNLLKKGQGILYGVQTLLFGQELIFFRVCEEGFSTEDYLAGLELLKNNNFPYKIDAISMPGIGSSEIINQAIQICSIKKALLIISEKDLYDYLTDKKIT